MHSNPLRAAIVRLGCALALLLPLVAFAAAPALDDAQKLYDAAKFTDAVALLRTALGTGQVTGNDVVAARAFLARCLVKAGQRLEAKQTFKTVLRLDPAWRPDAVMVPPDEMDVFNLALKEIQAEQVEAGQRVPASLAFYYGVGSGDNKSLGEVQKAIGGHDKLDKKPEFGGSVRFPLRPRLSLDIELARLRATGKDTISAPNTTKFESAAIPMVVSLYWAALPSAKHRVNLFLGAGPLLAASNSMDLAFFATRIQISDQKTGSYFHMGAEGEWLMSPKVSISARALYRSATAKDMFQNSTITFGPNNTPLKGRKVDFSGYGASIALRAYIGY
jgi:hypothetical protein